MRVIGVDFGSKRIGIAVGGDDPLIVSAQPNLIPTGTLKLDANAIFALAKKWEADGVVVGVPFNEQDQKMQRICKMLCDRLRETGITVYEVDESLTSLEAEQIWMEEGAKASVRKQMVDGEAARRIVERFFEQKEV